MVINWTWDGKDGKRGTPDESIIMTVCDRDPAVFVNVMRWLTMNDLSKSEIIIVDDGSRMEYEWLDAYLNYFPVRYGKMPEYPAYRIAENYNNPAKAFNAALEAALGERVAIMSSDVIVPPLVMQKARAQYSEDAVWCPMVVDLGTAAEYCGPHRVFPMPWFLYGSKRVFTEAGGWDENYLQGMCYEDNDFMGRVALTCDRIICDWSSAVWHQSHFQPAYEQTSDVVAANKLNRAYTLAKWTGMPWGDPDQLAFGIDRTRDPDTGSFCLKFHDIKDIKDKVIRETLSPFVTAPV